MKRSIVSLVAGLILTTACSAQPSETASYEDPNAVTTASGMVIEGAWMRTPPGGRDITAGYVFVRGASEQDDRLIAAHSDQVERIELHTVISEGGIMQMRPVEGYDIPAGETLELAPRGNHLMVFGSAKDPQWVKPG